MSWFALVRLWHVAPGILAAGLGFCDLRKQLVAQELRLMRFADVDLRDGMLRIGLVDFGSCALGIARVAQIPLTA